MNNHKFLFLVFLISFFFVKVHAQSDTKDVTITSSGSGKTLEEAKQNALRSATEQAFGTFISSKTEVLNDQVVADQMASISNGNIKSFEIINQDQFPDSRWGITVKAIVSIEKLTSFVQAKGITVDIKGGMFALNIKQQLLNEEGEIKAVTDMIGLLHESMQVSFNYEIKSKDPKSLDAESKNWEIPLTVTSICNKNIDFSANYFIKTLSGISLSTTEVESYKSLNKKVIPIVVKYKGNYFQFYLRKQISINAIISFLSNWNFYTKLFSVQSGFDETYAKGEGKIINIIEKNIDNITINFPTDGDVVGNFSWNDKRTLKQIEQISGYSVAPMGVVSNFKFGGYVVYESNGHGLIVSLCDLGEYNWDLAKVVCDKANLNGFNDWHLPSKLELQTVYNNLSQIGIGGFISDNYWTSTEGIDVASVVNFGTSKSWRPDYLNKSMNSKVRPVRSF
jgi:hypothetical protein